MAITISELVLGAIIVGLVVRLTRAGRAQSISRGDDAVMEQIQLGLTRLEARVEALETLLLDSQGTGDKR